jgi:hypothetical protein
MDTHNQHLHRVFHALYPQWNDHLLTPVNTAQTFCVTGALQAQMHCCHLAL